VKKKMCQSKGEQQHYHRHQQQQQQQQPRSQFWQRGAEMQERIYPNLADFLVSKSWLNSV